MRIISGSFKGRKILEPRDKITRPLKDLTKESIFNIIQHSKKFKINFSKSNVLDLFAGVGSFGIECLSRGVNEVIFVENYLGVLEVLEKNLLRLNSVRNFRILKKNIYKNETYKKLEDKFDIIFLDPPYKDRKLKILLDLIDNKNLVKKEGIIIVHMHKKNFEEINSNFNIIETKIYGISKVMFLKKLR